MPGAPQRTLHGLHNDVQKLRVARATVGESSRLSFEESDLLATVWAACDAVLLCDVLHYFPRELKAWILQRPFDAVRAGGSLLVREACSNGSTH